MAAKSRFASESCFVSIFFSRAIDSEPIQTRGIIVRYSPPSEWIMCELGVFPIFFRERPFKSQQNPRVDIF